MSDKQDREYERRTREAQESAPEFHDAGYDDTLPGQTEVIAGSAEHERLLNSYPNASSYGPDHNVVIPEETAADAGAPTVVNVPYVEQTDDTLTCTMGEWTGEPTSYTYEWFFNDTSAGVGGDTCTVGAGEVGQTATCVVSATNAAGTTSAPPSNSVVVA